MGKEKKNGKRKINDEILSQKARRKKASIQGENPLKKQGEKQVLTV